MNTSPPNGIAPHSYSDEELRLFGLELVTAVRAQVRGLPGRDWRLVMPDETADELTAAHQRLDGLGIEPGLLLADRIDCLVVQAREGAWQI